MKIIYTNTPSNKQRKLYPSFKSIAAMSCVIAVMVAIKVFYKPEESIEEVAAMANAVITEATSETESSESTTAVPEAVQTGTMYVSSVAYFHEAESELSVFPLRGEITSAFAERLDPFGGYTTEFHQGIDIAPEGDAKICAYMDGEVIMAGSDPSYGNFIKISHSDGLETIYAHCSSLLVEEGDEVKAGQIIAQPGDTGDATGVHLHFEIRIEGECVDPMGYFA